MRECINMSSGSRTPVKSRRKPSGKGYVAAGLSRVAAVPSAFKANRDADCRQDVQPFMRWLCTLLDEEREGLPSFLSEEATLEWFGRSVRSKRKVAGFLQCEVNSTRHHFATVDTCPPFTVRANKPKRAPIVEDEELARPLGDCHTPARLLTSLSLESSCKRPPQPHSPEEVACSTSKKVKKGSDSWDRNADDSADVRDCNKTPMAPHGRRPSDGSPAADDGAQRFYAEASGYVEFSRTRNRRKGEVKWERKCRLRVCYSANQPKADDYIIHSIVYSDETKCRRNLLPEFEEVARRADERAEQAQMAGSPAL